MFSILHHSHVYIQTIRNKRTISNANNNKCILNLRNEAFRHSIEVVKWCFISSTHSQIATTDFSTFKRHMIVCLQRLLHFQHMRILCTTVSLAKNQRKKTLCETNNPDDNNRQQITQSWICIIFIIATKSEEIT